MKQGSKESISQSPNSIVKGILNEQFKNHSFKYFTF